MKSKLLVKVAIPTPLRKTFDYILPQSLAKKNIRPGMRVRVPFGKREAIGLILGKSHDSTVPAEKLRSILEVLDSEAALDRKTLDLYLWASDYYQFPVGQALQTSLPRFVREGKPLIMPVSKKWHLTSKGQNSTAERLKRAPQQQKLIQLLQQHEKLSTKEINKLLNTSSGGLLKALEEKQLIQSIAETKDSPASAGLYGEQQALTLNSEQLIAVEAVKEKLNSFCSFLLEGITGSGKTEVYLQLAAEVLKQSRQVLVLVPEISLTPQIIDRFKRRFNRHIVTLHSGMSDTERFVAWLQASNGEADIVIGTRSAIFTPLAKPGLIIVDEEHDSSYKQQEGFRYSARDLSIYRARMLKIPVLLGSATPSLESLQNVQTKRYQLLSLSQRAGAAFSPQFNFIDLKGESLEDGFSQTLLSQIGNHLEKGNQVLIFINRRGFAPILQCQECGWIAICNRCETGYTLHQNPPSLRCHHCDSQRPVPSSCVLCKGSNLSAIGLGTERSEKALKTHFPNTSIIRVDRDSTRRKNTLSRMIDKIQAGKPCILIGTQMLAKGHHFPGVTMVAILDADSGLFSSDFRGQEQMGQLLTQVAGRAGRGSSPGVVFIQTYHSTHPSLNLLVTEGYGKFARQLLNERKKAKLPPFTHQALIRAEASNSKSPYAFLKKVKNHSSQWLNPGLVFLGPMPAPMEKRAGKFRAQLMIQARKRSSLHQFLRLLVEAFEQHPEARKVRWSVDVDPLDFS